MPMNVSNNLVSCPTMARVKMMANTIQRYPNNFFVIIFREVSKVSEVYCLLRSTKLYDCRQYLSNELPAIAIIYYSAVRQIQPLG